MLMALKDEVQVSTAGWCLGQGALSRWQNVWEQGTERRERVTAHMRMTCVCTGPALTEVEKIQQTPYTSGGRRNKGTHERRVGDMQVSHGSQKSVCTYVL